jgi:hypothetical protein
MIFTQLQNYRVYECDHSIDIIPNGRVLMMPGAAALIEANLSTCCEFVIRYAEHRANGHDWQKAKELALRGANVIKVHGK